MSWTTRDRSVECLDYSKRRGYLVRIAMRHPGGDVMENCEENLSCPEGWRGFFIAGCSVRSSEPERSGHADGISTRDSRYLR